MIEKPPDDPADHAQDFASRYAEVMDYLTGDRMTELGIPTGKIGTRVPGQGYFTFVPSERTGGGNDPRGGLTVDSAIFNPDLYADLGEEVSSFWAKSRLRDRMDAVIAHEHAEALGATHLEAVEHAADTQLPIREGARILLRVIAGQKPPRRT